MISFIQDNSYSPLPDVLLPVVLRVCHAPEELLAAVGAVPELVVLAPEAVLLQRVLRRVRDAEEAARERTLAVVHVAAQPDDNSNDHY